LVLEAQVVPENHLMGMAAMDMHHHLATYVQLMVVQEEPQQVDGLLVTEAMEVLAVAQVTLEHLLVLEQAAQMDQMEL
jgi:hypothetical protein